MDEKIRWNRTGCQNESGNIVCQEPQSEIGWTAREKSRQPDNNDNRLQNGQRQNMIKEDRMHQLLLILVGSIIFIK
ncbi:MAG: hypothetical protein R3C12_09355 [Planctomycetaceae bacterium]